MYCWIGGDDAPDYYDLHPYRTKPPEVSDPKRGNDRRRRQLMAQPGMTEQQCEALIASAEKLKAKDDQPKH